MYRCLLLIFGSIVLGACQAEAPLSQEHPIHISEAVNGQELIIRYHQSHPRAQFTTDSLMIATLYVYSADEIRCYRQPMQAAKTALECSWTLPQDAVFIRAEVSPPHVLRTRENAAGLTLHQNDFQPGGIAWMMQRARDEAELMHFFVEDSTLYPQNLSRWYGLFSQAPRLKTPRQTLERYVQNLGKELTHINSSDLRTRIDGHVILGMAAQLLHQPTEMATHINMLHELTSKLPALKPTMENSVSLVANLGLATIIDRDFQVQTDSTYSEKFNTRLQQYIEIANNLNSSRLQAEILICAFRYRSLIPRYPRVFTQALEVFAQNTSNWSACEHAMHPSVALSLAVVSEVLEEDVVAVQIEQLLEKLKSVNSWEPESAQECVSHSDIGGRITSGFLYLSRLYKAIEDLESEKRLLHKSLEVKGQHVSGAHSLSAVRLAHIYADLGVLDSAVQFYAQAEHLSSPFAEEAFIKINEIRESNGLATLNKLATLQQHAEFAPPKATHPIHGELITRAGSLNYNSTAPLFLLFSGAECSVCTEYMPGIRTELIKHFPEDRIVLVTNDQPEVIEQLYGKDVLTAELTPKVAALHQVNILPAIQIVRDNNIELKFASVSETSVQQILFNLERQETSRNAKLNTQN